MHFYTYLHCKPDGAPFYVGKGRGNRCCDFHHRSQHHKHVVEKYGRANIGVFVFPCESEDAALADEVQQIAQLRAEGFRLCNATDGGDGISGLKHSVETRRKMSEKAAGRSHSPESIAKISAAKRNLSDETRSRISAAKLGRKRPPFSAEHRAKMAAKAMGNRRGVGNKSRIGQMASVETKEKMAEGQRLAWLRRRCLTGIVR